MPAEGPLFTRADGHPLTRQWFVDHIQQALSLAGTDASAYNGHSFRSLPGDVQQAWYADDASASGSLKHLRAWWDELLSLGPAYGYNANALKTWLITKQQYLQSAKEAFRGTLVNISADGRLLLGAALGTREYTERYVNKKVMEWCSELENLASIADTQPHAAYMLP